MPRRASCCRRRRRWRRSRDRSTSSFTSHACPRPWRYPPEPQQQSPCQRLQLPAREGSPLWRDGSEGARATALRTTSTASGSLRSDVEPEERHDAVAGVLVGHPARALDGAAHRLEVSVEKEHDVVRQPMLCQPGEAAKVGEEDDDLLLAAAVRVAGRAAVGGGGRGGQERRDREIGGRPQLTGQADVARHAEAAQHAALRLGGRRLGPCRMDAHAACRAAPAAAADRGVRNARVAADLEHGEPDGHDDATADRKSTRLNSSHVAISYAVFCLKKKKKTWI